MGVGEIHLLELRSGNAPALVPGARLDGPLEKSHGGFRRLDYCAEIGDQPDVFRVPGDDIARLSRGNRTYLDISAGSPCRGVGEALDPALPHAIEHRGEAVIHQPDAVKVAHAHTRLSPHRGDTRGNPQRAVGTRPAVVVRQYRVLLELL